MHFQLESNLLSVKRKTHFITRTKSFGERREQGEQIQESEISKCLSLYPVSVFELFTKIILILFSPQFSHLPFLVTLHYLNHVLESLALYAHVSFEFTPR
jgi:hypothetical protein